jgi:hypothetical protein
LVSRTTIGARDAFCSCGPNYRANLRRRASVDLFGEKKAELSAIIRNALGTQGRLVQQVGKATDAWIRLESQLQMELMIRERIKAA